MRTGPAATMLALAMLLAGCSGDGAGGANAVRLGDGSQVQLADVEATATTGAISGVVVDEAIRPLAGVNVSLSGGPGTQTDAQGLFTFADLEPGLYTVSAAGGAGYLPIQSTAEVEAGAVAKLRIVLPVDPAPRPYHSTFKFDWYDEAGVALVDFAVDLVGRSFLNGTLPPMCDRCYFYFQSDGPVDTFVIEAMWEDTVPDVAEGSTEYYWVLDGYDSGEYEDDYFASPGRAEIDAGALGNDTNFGLGLSADEDWVTYQQKAELFVTLFYLAPPPEGWSVVGGA